jgi:hypothetical protein
MLKDKCHLYFISVGNSGGQKTRTGGLGGKGEKMDGKVCCSPEGGNSAGCRKEGNVGTVYVTGHVMLFSGW